MARIFITGSADGLGQLAAQLLVNQGHEVVLHARNNERADHALKATKGAVDVIVGELSDLEATKAVASSANALGRFDAVIHNAGIYQQSPKAILNVNVLAPYILTCLMNKPSRLVYLSSGMHLSGHANIDTLATNSGVSYSDSKLYVLMLSMAVAKRWSDVYSNAVDPGWVPTRMGGKSAPDNLQKGYETQAWLASSDDLQAKVSGRYFFHQKQKRHNAEADDEGLVDKFIAVCKVLTGISLPQ